MSRIRPIARLAALLLIWGAAASAHAQQLQPFIDPGYFEPDFQFFAPADVGDFGGQDFANTGVYFDYDRLYLALNRPDGEASLFSNTDMDFSWGNRFEIGYMTEEDTGWQAVLQHYVVDETLTVFQERLDRFNDADDQAGGTPDPIFQDRNPRYYDLRTTVNSARFSSLELNKVWRRKEFHRGTILEPVVGFRYMTFRDRYVRDNYERFAEDIAGQPVPGVPTVDGTYEQFTTNEAFFDNKMVGGQLGARLFHQRGHWLLSGEVRMFALANFQTLENYTLTRLTRYSAVPGATPPVVEFENQAEVRDFDHLSGFVWGGEVRAEASYELTRDIALRFGMLFIDLGQGIGRGNNLRDNNQDVQMAGLTFGLTINR